VALSQAGHLKLEGLGPAGKFMSLVLSELSLIGYVVVKVYILTL
jgi:hypothetical protein